MRLAPIRASLRGSAREPKNASRIFISGMEEAVWMPNHPKCKAFIINALQDTRSGENRWKGKALVRLGEILLSCRI
jgi:hypothetical protein